MPYDHCCIVIMFCCGGTAFGTVFVSFHLILTSYLYITAPQRKKNTVRAMQINCNLLLFLLEECCRYEQTTNSLS